MSNIEALEDLFINIGKFDENNIVYSKPLSFPKVSKNLGIYYKKKIADEDSKKKIIKQKIIIETPKMLVPWDIKEYTTDSGKKYCTLSISFASISNLYNEDDINKFFNFIKKIDKNNEEVIIDYRKEWGLSKQILYKPSVQRTSDKYSYFMNLYLPSDDIRGLLFDVYDEDANKSDLKIIGKRSIIKVVLELSNINFSLTESRARWTILQIRKFKPYSPIQEFFLSKCVICDQDDPEDTVYDKLVDSYQQKLNRKINLPQIGYTNQNNIMTILSQMSTFMQSNTNIPQLPYIPTPKIMAKDTDQPVSFTPPSKTQLSDAIKKLKKTVTIEKNMQTGKVLEEIIPMPSPPPPPPKKRRGDRKIKI